MRQKIKFGLMLGVVLGATTLLAKPIELVLDGQTLQTESAPIQEKGVTLVPLRVISESLGANVKYEKDSQQIKIVQGNNQIDLTIGKQEAYVNNQKIALEVEPRIISGTTLVPLRLISENLGCRVEWDAKNQKIELMSQKDQKVLPIATLTIKGLGEIKAELYPSFAPNTVNNFISLANGKFYDGLTFHRVIGDFMIQGGCPQGNGTGGPGYSISGEFIQNGFKENTLNHTEGVLSMARSNRPNSAGSQFFIMTSQSPHLDGQYAAFGKVISGMDIVYQIEGVSTNRADCPIEPVIIESIRVDTKGQDYEKPIKINE